MQLAVHADVETLALAAARLIAELLRQAVAERGRATLVLAGGTTPRRTYELLAEGAGRDASLAIPWERVEVFFGDERRVPAGDPRSNATMARATLFARATVAPARVHAMPTEGVSPEADAATHERVVRAALGDAGADGATFDVVVLGVGTDGHTASLFPGTAAPAERARWVVAVEAPPGIEPRERLTMTWPVLERARAIVVLCAGADKRAVLAALRTGAGAADALPAARLAALPQARWLADRAAAGGA
jgi:6-phosphogluconolactonase